MIILRQKEFNLPIKGFVSKNIKPGEFIKKGIKGTVKNTGLGVIDYRKKVDGKFISQRGISSLRKNTSISAPGITSIKYN